MKNILVFSIALNGYQYIYKKFLRSHENYAKKINADYALIDSPKVVALGTECCWLKIPLILAAFERGYEYVLFVDADAFIQESAPDIRLFDKSQGFLYMAKGRSDRWNSGVIFAKKHAKSIQFFQSVVSNRHIKLNLDDSVGWGENGHIIRADKSHQIVKKLPLKWNNTFKHDLDDYIRHFNAGEFRKRKTINLFHNTLHWLTNHLFKVAKEEVQVSCGFESMVCKIIKSYPNFFKKSQFAIDSDRLHCKLRKT